MSDPDRLRRGKRELHAEEERVRVLERQGENYSDVEHGKERVLTGLGQPK
jgi:hypothetical protein